MRNVFDRAPGASLLVLVLATIVVIAGAIVCIANPQHFPFRDYVEDVTILAGALGISTAIGAGLSAVVNGKEPPERTPAVTTPPTRAKEPLA